jgi:hypothetical protein
MKINFGIIIKILFITGVIVASFYLTTAQEDVKNVLQIIMLSICIAIAVNVCIYYFKPELCKNKKIIDS